MNDAAAAVDWRDLREFRTVDLSRSYVLSWHVESEILLVDVDVVLLPDHPFYETPRPNEKVCIRPAIIEFPYCERLLHGDKEGSVARIAAAIGHGAIEGLRRFENGCVEIIGEFGVVLIDAELPQLRLKGRKTQEITK